MPGLTKTKCIHCEAKSDSLFNTCALKRVEAKLKFKEPGGQKVAK